MPSSTLDDATRALEQSTHEFNQAVKQATKTLRAADEVRFQRLQNHIGPSIASAIARYR